MCYKAAFFTWYLVSASYQYLFLLQRFLSEVILLLYKSERQDRIQDPAKHLRWSFLLKQLTTENRLTIFAKISILDIWLVSAYTLKKYCQG